MTVLEHLTLLQLEGSGIGALALGGEVGSGGAAGLGILGEHGAFRRGHGHLVIAGLHLADVELTSLVGGILIHQAVVDAHQGDEHTRLAGFVVLHDAIAVHIIPGRAADAGKRGGTNGHRALLPCRQLQHRAELHIVQAVFHDVAGGGVFQVAGLAEAVTQGHGDPQLILSSGNALKGGFGLLVGGHHGNGGIAAHRDQLQHHILHSAVIIVAGAVAVAVVVHTDI